MNHFILIAISFAAALATVPAQAAEYTARRIADLGGRETVALALNERAEVVGYSRIPSGHRHAFLTGPGAKGIKDLGPDNPGKAAATAINNRGEVAGYEVTERGLRTYRTAPGGEHKQWLHTFNGRSDMTPAGINMSRQVTGQSRYTHGVIAYITDPGGREPHYLGSFNAWGNYPQAINDDGCVAGYSDNPQVLAMIAFIVCQGDDDLRDIGNLGEPNARAMAINASGQVAGYADVDSKPRAFLTDAGGTGMRDIGTPAGFTNAKAKGINNEGRVVGVAYGRGAAKVAFVTGPDGSDPRDLNTLVARTKLKFVSAQDINDKGQILVVDKRGDSYLLTPVAPAHAMGGSRR